MITCEKLCGECSGECAFLRGALKWYAVRPDNPLGAACVHIAQTGTSAGPTMLRAIRMLDQPEAIAYVLLCALRGRGVAEAIVKVRAAIEIRVPEEYLGEVPSGVREYTWTMAEARAALSRLLAARLCGPDAALRLLHQPTV